MKVHYINILLFALPLNILVYNQRNHYITIYTQTNRSLCECELYAPANYGNDSQMKSVLENFNKQTQQRFEAYDDRMKTTRQKCKDKCDKESQKIILKDKLEKELMDKFATLQTDIQSDAIPTCICGKSLADKVEKGCLRCGEILGAAMPEIGSIGGSLLSALYAWKPKAIAAAMEAAKDAATKAATNAGVNAVVSQIHNELFLGFCRDPKLVNLKSIVTPLTFDNGSALHKGAMKLASKSCDFGGRGIRSPFCNTIEYGEKTNFVPYAEAGRAAHDATFTLQKGAIEAAQEKAIETTFMGNQTAIIASIIAIVVIVLIMVIIYLILRYRRKKKMKKKLQYIKLLEK
ncbi:rifin PIR protein, putative [Plasmodium reichenowi]|uniref:Rifin PIR protein, putative n=1 Tax=Plasmodium reichenowi TaxID=5854 RepID=A0A2P9DSG7_PLARE|nr:rifin PIR protein, putative [Plasmodium reichenowi]